MTSITHTPVTLTDHETEELGLAKAGHVYSATIFANELSRDGLSVDIDGMDFSNYQKNPVVLFAHDYSGRTESSGLPNRSHPSTGPDAGRPHQGRVRVPVRRHVRRPRTQRLEPRLPQGRVHRLEGYRGATQQTRQGRPHCEVRVDRVVHSGRPRRPGRAQRRIHPRHEGR